MKFTVASFNCNSVRSRLPVILDWLRRRRPDVLALQETRAVDEDFPAAAFPDAGYHVVFRGEKAHNGVALAGLAKPTNVSFGLDDGGPPDEARLIRADFAGVPVVNTYVPQGQDVDSPHFRYKLAWLGRLRDYFQRHFTPRRRLLWAGDFNVAPAPIDVYDSKKIMGHVCHNPQVFEALAAVQSWGFVDVFRKHRPGPGEYTFFDYRLRNSLERGLGWRVDHIWATRPLAARSVDAWVDLEPRRAEKPSDHTPVAAVFEL